MIQEMYTLLKKNGTQELHIFIDDCSQSICSWMNRNESDADPLFFYEPNHSTARKKCANIGKSVCSHCVSHLYDTYQTKGR